MNLSPKVKLVELTPPSMQSFPVGCPAIFSGDDGNYYIIGQKVDETELLLSERVMKGEVLIKVDKALVDLALS